MSVQQVLLKLLPTSASHYVLKVKYLCNRNHPDTPPADIASQTVVTMLAHPCAGMLWPRCAVPGVQRVMFPNTYTRQ